jgi:hypothetical protein
MTTTSNRPRPTLSFEGEQHRDGQRRQQRRNRPLDEDRRALRDPENPPEMTGDRFIAARREIDLRQRALRRHAAGQQHRIGLGVAPLEGRGEDRRHDQAGGDAGIGAEKIGSRPGDRQHRDGNAQRRDRAIDPDRGFGALPT